MRDNYAFINNICGFVTDVLCVNATRFPDVCIKGTARGRCQYRGTSLIRKRTPLEPYRRPMPRIVGGSQGGGHFLMG